MPDEYQSTLDAEQDAHEVSVRDADMDDEDRAAYYAMLEPQG